MKIAVRVRPARSQAGRGAMLVASLILAVPSSATIPSRAETFVRNDLKLDRYRLAVADLDGDGAPEVLVYADGPQWCGSGGCVLYILTPQAQGYRIVTRLTVVRPPIRVLTTRTRGWSDLGVLTAGGGVRRSYEARLRFDGRSYPRNPTVAPTIPHKGIAGRTLLE